MVVLVQFMNYNVIWVTLKVRRPANALSKSQRGNQEGGCHGSSQLWASKPGERCKQLKEASKLQDQILMGGLQLSEHLLGGKQYCKAVQPIFGVYWG